MSMNKKLAYLAVIVVVIAAIAYRYGYIGPSQSGMHMAANSKPTVNVTVPQLDQVAKLGEADFNANCAQCHGKNAAGTGKGPPLIHRIYEPNHHGDFSFKRAVELGVRSHHWPFGNMPPQQQVKDFELARIVTYVRTLQKANGIF